MRGAVKKALSDLERDWGGAAVTSEWMVVYLRPFELQPDDKAAKKVGAGRLPPVFGVD